MKYLFIKMDKDNFETKVAEDINEFKDFYEYINEVGWEDVFNTIELGLKSHQSAIRFNGHPVKYCIVWNLDEKETSNSKEIVDVWSCMTGYNVDLFKDLHCYDENFVDVLNEKLNDKEQHCMEWFESYEEAMYYLMNVLKDDNDYYYGCVTHYRHEEDWEKDPEYGWGECKECDIISDMSAEYID